MITRKADKKDALAGFTYDWVKKIGEKTDNLKVICLEKGDISDLPENVEIYSLGGEKGFGKLRKFWNFQKLAFKLMSKVDGVFCHMNPEYTILAAPYAKLFRKKIISWYTHKKVTWKLRLINLLANKIITASEESCRLKDRGKIEAVGHGIDTGIFTPVILSQQAKNPEDNEIDTGSFAETALGRQRRVQDDGTANFKFIILSIGRISPVKDYETLINAIEILIQKEIKNLELQIIGGPGLKSQQEYFEKLKQSVKEKKLENYIKFLGPVSHNQILSYYQNCDLFINLSRTGSIDKTVLEAMACEKLVLTSNEAFKDILKSERLFFSGKAEELSEKIIWIMNLPFEERGLIGKKLREKIIKNHNLDNLIDKILSLYESK
ncbi:MAG: group 1 glycosyl transferase [Parcubacteria group bacterium Athens1014_10]|nr:MAG: group 1 glycosyl transferase [Parcubacteria group bacterium Athens1014_10]TSD04472.1 MAG: group 1 glycosyl transferase [Parcubacteria group bacterium Athens0714_12]